MTVSYYPLSTLNNYALTHRRTLTTGLSEQQNERSHRIAICSGLYATFIKWNEANLYQFLKPSNPARSVMESAEPFLILHLSSELRNKIYFELLRDFLYLDYRWGSYV